MGGAIVMSVGATAPTSKLKNSRNGQIFTIFAPRYYISSHPQGKRTLLRFALAPPLPEKALNLDKVTRY